jgi:Putative Actinobacterial Holin-X, holin superfamily III
VTDDNSSLADEAERTPPSPAEQVRTLIGDVRALAEAEIDYAKARFSYSGGIIRKAGLWALLAIFFLSGAIIALILGLLLIIAAYFGPWVATVTVVAVFALAAWGSAIYARKTANNLRFNGDEDV